MFVIWSFFSTSYIFYIMLWCFTHIYSSFNFSKALTEELNAAVERDLRCQRIVAHGRWISLELPKLRLLSYQPNKSVRTQFSTQKGRRQSLLFNCLFCCFVLCFNLMHASISFSKMLVSKHNMVLPACLYAFRPACFLSCLACCVFHICLSIWYTFSLKHSVNYISVANNPEGSQNTPKPSPRPATAMQVRQDSQPLSIRISIRLFKNGARKAMHVRECKCTHVYIWVV